MRNTTRAGAAVALLCGVAFAAAGAVAQTSSPSTSPSTTSPSAQGQINPSDDQANAFIKSLENFAMQAVPGLKPNVGASVPKDVKLQPMPPAAQQALPQAKDHHIAKTDDQTILIVDPVTRQVVGVIQAADADDDDDNGMPGSGSAPSASPGNGTKK